MIEDTELLRRYAEEKSEAAFAELVQRRIGLVYSVALRRTGGDVHSAEDATQKVFVDLARKAPALCRRAVLAGWLCRSAQFAARDVVRVERRRSAREQEAYLMDEIERQASEPKWDELRPVLDELLNEMSDQDRDALLLRFYDGRHFAEIGARLRLTENTARMRVERALDKLRLALGRRGAVSTAGALGLALAQQASIAAPAGLAATVTGPALSAAMASGGSALALVTFLTMNKLKIGIVVIAIVGLTTTAVELRANRTLRKELRPISGPAEEKLVASLQRANRELSTQVAEVAAKHPDAGELTRVRTRISALKARPDGVTDDQLRPARNLGRDTPAAAMETFCWAIDQNDPDLLAPFTRFSDDTAENRAAFMANFSSVVQERYQTPERLFAVATFGVGQKRPMRDDSQATLLQIVSVDEDHSPDQVKIKIWWRTPEGKEAGGTDTFYRYPDGWAGKQVPLLKTVVAVKSRLDPSTGDWIPVAPAHP